MGNYPEPPYYYHGSTHQCHSKMTSLKVNHISTTVSFQELKAEFKDFGRCKVVLHTGTNGENYAYVNYFDVLDAEVALQQMNQRVLDGKKITVKRQCNGGSSSTSYSVQPEKHTVKVTGLSKKTTEETLTGTFEAASPDARILSVKINKGLNEFNWAYVNYSSLNDAQRAVQLYNGAKIGSSKIQVKLHQSLPDSHTKIPPVVDGYSQPSSESVSWWHPQNSASATYFKFPASAPVGTDCSTLKVTMHPHSLRSKDLMKAFGEFGELRDKPKVIRGTPSYAYINFVSPRDALEACQAFDGRYFKDVRLTVTLNNASECHHEHNAVVSTHNPTGSTTTGHGRKQIACDPLLAKLITSRINSFEEQLKHITQSMYVPVTIAPMKSGNGVNLIGKSEHLVAVEQFVLELITGLKAGLRVEQFSLECKYIPLFGKTEITKTFSDIEEKYTVEFCVVNNDSKRTIPVNAFSTLVSEELFSKSDKTAKTSSLPMFISTPTSCNNHCASEEDEWSWKTDDGSFTPYCPDICTKLNEQFKLSPSGSFSCKILTKMGTFEYTIDFETMTQTNKRSKNTRSIQHIVKSDAGNVKWMYEGEGGKLIPFSSKESEEIEKLNDFNTSCSLVVDSTTYVFDFSQKTRTNDDTNEKCKIHRKVLISPKGPCVHFSINGLPEDVLLATEHLKSELSKKVIKKEIPLPTPVEKIGDSLLKTASQYFVSAEIIKDKLVLEGVEGYLEKVQLVITEEKHAYEKQIVSQGMASAQAAAELPEYWEPQKEKIELKPVQQGSPEWHKIAKRFHETLPCENIVKIERIQNKWLWDKYNFSKQRMLEKNGGVVNEKELFHGTSGTHPEKVFKSEQGFDFRFASSGMWGTGTYFAVNASYSRSYAYRNGSKKQFILAKVLTGETYRCPPNGSLKKPPVKTHKHAPQPLFSSLSLPSMFTLGITSSAAPSTGSNTKGDFEDELYDSVSGNTGNSDIFIIYDHEKAYPAYLITFQ